MNLVYAVDECIREGILKEFLQKNRAEVLKVSIFEYDQEEEERKLRKTEFEAGYGTGYDTGYDTGKLDERSKIVKSMLSAGEMMEKIADYTGCTVEEIEKIRKDFSAE